jgi:two-component system sensor histidine kinase HydH
MTTSSPSSSPSTRIEELGRIILAYSEVTERLQQSQERLEKTVTALRNELSEKNRQLERKNRLAALGEMAAGMAHEIRNPLGGIQLYASMLAQDVADRPAALEVTRKISSGVKRLEALVSQVLQFTREIAAHCVEMDLGLVVAQAAELAGPHYEKRGVTLTVEGPPSLGVRGDPLLLGQAILNLLLNAAEAMERQGAGGTRGQTVLKYGWVDQRLVLSVTDTGPGIPPAVLDKMFNPFFTTRETGTGLGLAIVHRIVEAHEGTITASNRPEGGARFENRI